MIFRRKKSLDDTKEADNQRLLQELELKNAILELTENGYGYWIYNKLSYAARSSYEYIRDKMYDIIWPTQPELTPENLELRAQALVQVQKENILNQHLSERRRELNARYNQDAANIRAKKNTCDRWKTTTIDKLNSKWKSNINHSFDVDNFRDDPAWNPNPIELKPEYETLCKNLGCFNEARNANIKTLPSTNIPAGLPDLNLNNVRDLTSTSNEIRTLNYRLEENFYEQTITVLKNELLKANSALTQLINENVDCAKVCNQGQLNRVSPMVPELTQTEFKKSIRMLKKATIEYPPSMAKKVARILNFEFDFINNVRDECKGISEYVLNVAIIIFQAALLYLVYYLIIQLIIISKFKIKQMIERIRSKNDDIEVKNHENFWRKNIGILADLIDIRGGACPNVLPISKLDPMQMTNLEIDTVELLLDSTFQSALYSLKFSKKLEELSNTIKNDSYYYSKVSKFTLIRGKISTLKLRAKEYSLYVVASLAFLSVNRTEYTNINHKILPLTIAPIETPLALEHSAKIPIRLSNSKNKKKITKIKIQKEPTIVIKNSSEYSDLDLINLKGTEIARSEFNKLIDKNKSANDKSALITDEEIKPLYLLKAKKLKSNVRPTYKIFPRCY